MNVIPITIREDPDLIVYIQGIPHDLTAAEAQKIIRVVMALAGPIAPAPKPGEGDADDLL